MINKILTLWKNTLVKGTFILLVSTNILNVFGYLFQYLMLMLLTPTDYGTLFALMSLMAMITSPINVLGRVGVKYAAEIKAKGDFELLTGLFNKLMGYAVSFAVVVFIVFMLLASSFSKFLNIPGEYFLMFTILLSVGIFSSIPGTFLNGLLRFKGYSFTTVSQGAGKIIFPFIMFYLGYKLNGILLGLTLSFLFSLAIGYLLLRKNLRNKAKNFEVAKIVSLAKPLILIIVIMAALFNIDVVLVKKFFEPYDAGLYSAIALVGRIILYGSSAAAVVLLPLVSERVVRGSDVKKPLFLSMAIVLSLGLIGTSFLFLFPNFVVNFVMRGDYPESAAYLGWFGLFMVLFSLIHVVTNFFIGVNRFGIWKFLLVPLALQVVGISMFHESLWQVIVINIMCMSLVLIMYIYFLYDYFTNVKNKKFAPSSLLD